MCPASPAAPPAPPSPSPAPETSVLVRHFAVLRERRGCEEEAVALRPGDTPARVFARLVPDLAAGGLRVMYAVDHAYVDPDAPLAPGAELAFIPPLGGG